MMKRQLPIDPNDDLTETPAKPAGRGRPSKEAKAKSMERLKRLGNPASVARSQTVADDQDASKQAKTVLGSGYVLNHKPTVQIHQIFFKHAQRPKLDPTMLPFDNTGRRHPLLEYDVFKRIIESELSADADYWGALSWKFHQVMGITGRSLADFIGRNPGFDVYFCHPNTSVEAMYENMWIQGAISHPRFLELSRDFLDAAQLESSMLNKVVPSGFMASSNYFVANHRFWSAYTEFIDNALAAANSKLDESVRAELLSPAADPRNLHHGACYLPFIVERLFGEFLMLHAGQFKAFKLKSPRLEAKLSPHHQSMRTMKDMAVKNRATWLLDCWRNYRNLLLSATTDPAELEPYHALLNNPNVEFSDVPLYY